MAGIDIDSALNRLITQYRESPKLQHVIRVYLQELSLARCAIEEIPNAFNLHDATGDQLTIIGRRMGFGREHCVCSSQPVYGWECEDGNPNQNITDFCDVNGIWASCDSSGTGTITIEDDEIYRSLLKSRAYQLSNRNDLASVCQAIQGIFGEQANVARDSNNQVVIVIGRDLTAQEIALLQIFPRVLPLALGVEARFHFGEFDNIFGFGEGWAGFCGSLPSEPVEIITNGSDYILANDGDRLIIDIEQPVDTPQWLCSTDVRPYGCVE